MKHALKILFLLIIPFVLKGQVGDCPGSCIITNGTYTVAAGSVDELTPTNGGCLGALEGSSSIWVPISFTTSGTFYMAINPNGGKNDYDFAIWNGTTCTPTTSPIRCSFAATPFGGPDQTGLGNGAVDLTEDAFGDQWVAPLSVAAGQSIIININNYGSGSNVFHLSFAGTTATMACPIGLPIDLIKFESVLIDKTAVISWATASELNNDYFELEHSTDAQLWHTIHIEEGNGTSNFITNYGYVHKQIQEGENYYRLKQNDYNGESNYSNIVVVNNTIERSLIKTIDMLGNLVDSSYEGIVIEIYDDGTVKKKINIK